jgi:hypothetical protein
MPFILCTIISLNFFVLFNADSVEIRTEFDYDIRVEGTRTKPIKEKIGDIDGDGLSDLISKFDEDVHVILGKDINNSSINTVNDYSFKLENSNPYLNLITANVFDYNEDGFDDIFIQTYSHFGFPIKISIK